MSILLLLVPLSLVLLGVAIGNDGEHAVFVHAGEISRALKVASGR